MTTNPVSETPHTKEPWSWDAGDIGYLYSVPYCGISGPDDEPIADVKTRHDARRIVSCVNACSGIPTDKLESDYCQGYEPWGHVEHLQKELNAANARIKELEAKLATARDEALNQAVNVCLNSCSGHRYSAPDAARRNCAELIRSLKSSSGGGG